MSDNQNGLMLLETLVGFPIALLYPFFLVNQ